MRQKQREVDKCIIRACQKLTWEDEKGVHEIKDRRLRKSILNRRSGFKINEVVCSSCRDKLAREQEKAEEEKISLLRAGGTVCGDI